jgi:asparagine synthase (glutamine-hydrolysing)
MGPRWIGVRAYYAAQNKLRLARRRLPIESWDSRPLASHLRSDVPCDPVAYMRWRQSGAGKFFFGELPLADQLSSVSQCQAVSQADALVAGRWIYFGRLSVEAGMPPNWHLNPLTGESAPADLHWTEIPDFAFGDIKLIWEANRFTPVCALVRGYALTQDDRYAEAFWTLVEDWAAHNPPQRGANWKCGQESSFRVMAWCFGLYGFSASQHTTPARVAALSKMIAVTAERIEANIGYALSQNNNHGISEAVGLFSIGTLFPEFRRAGFWRSKGRRLLEQLARRQIYPDGAYVQHSTNYHRVMLHDYLWALRLAELNGEPFSLELYEQLRRSSEFLDNLTDTHSGEAPNYGNNDGTLVLPLCDCDYGDFRPTLQAARYLLSHQRRFARGCWDEMMVWLFGAQSLNAPITPMPTRESIASHSGYYILRGHESWAMIRCAEYRDRPAQADQLHLDLWWRGLNIAVDSGTYLYNAPPPWDEAFAASAAHNTITVDGKDQMRRLSRFLWLDWAQGSHLLYRREGDREFWQGEHNGYGLLGVNHRRTVERQGDMWNVIDDVIGEGQQRVSLHWLLPDFPRVIDAEAQSLKLKSSRGWVAVTTRCTVATVFTVVRAGQRISDTASHAGDLTRGWISHTYASKEPALSLRLDAEAPLPIRFETRFEFARSVDNFRTEPGFAEGGK